MSHHKKSLEWLFIGIPLLVLIAGVTLAGKPPKDPPPPRAPIIATTTDRNFLEVDVDKVACQTEFALGIDVSGDGTHYRYKVGPVSSTDPYDETGYSAPIEKPTPAYFDLTGHADTEYVLCLLGLKIDKRGRIKDSQPLSEATTFYWEKDTAPVEYHVTFTGALENDTLAWVFAIDNSGTAVGSAPTPDGMGDFPYHAIRWNLETGLEDISSLAVPWFDLETYEFVDGWVFARARDINEAGQMAGVAWDGTSKRACVYDPLAGFLLLPRLTDTSYDEANYAALSINQSGQVQVDVLPPVPSTSPRKACLWTPTNPEAIHIIEPAVEENLYPNGIGTNIFRVFHTLPDASHLDLYVFQFNAEGVLWYELLDTVSDSAGLVTQINDRGAFAYGSDNGTVQSIKLYRTGQPTLAVRESTNAVFEHPGVAYRINDSNDFVYNSDSIPYLYRHAESRSYRLYDLADSYTKSVLFASCSGKLKNSTKGVYYAVVSDDDGASAPVTNPFDTIGGWVSYDLTTGTSAGFVLVPIPSQ